MKRTIHPMFIIVLIVTACYTALAGVATRSLGAKQDINAAKAQPRITEARRDHWSTVTNYVFKLTGIPASNFVEAHAVVLEPWLSRNANKSRAGMDNSTTLAEFKGHSRTNAMIAAIGTAILRLEANPDFRFWTEHRKQQP